MIELLQSIGTIVLFFVILGTLVLVHEVGHFVVARLARVRVLEFGIGFPPRAKVLSRGGETVYTLNWLPIGGFVKLEGEDGDTGDDPRSFSAARLPIKLLILVAGVVMNVLIAFTIFTAIAWLATPMMGITVPSVAPDSPAERAGLRAGDEILGLNGEQFELFGGETILSSIRDHAGETVTLEVRRADGTRETLTATLRPESELTETRGALGIPPTETVGYEQVPTGDYLSGRPLGDALAIGVEQTTGALSLILDGLGSIIGGIAADPTAPPPAAGPVGIALQIGDIAWGLGPVFTLYFAAILSANLALVNALPFPPLDGGRMLVVTLKALVGQRLSIRVERLTYFVGFVVLFAFLIYITVFDIARLGGAID